MAGRAFISRFSPNRTDPEVLEAIFVQRHRLAEVWFERLRDSVLTGVKHHLLAVGPRGCGKSHLVALLVGRLRKDPAVRERVCIAWLSEEEATPTFWKFLLRILRALNAEHDDEFPPLPRDQLADASDDRRSAVLTDYLLKKLDGRVLLVVVENLDEVMRGLKDEGQKRWRAFLQEHQVAATLASAQQLTEDVSDHDRPFFNFFQVEHLEPLSADEALSLLRKIAEHKNNRSLAAYLQTPTGRARVRAIRHVTGGNHRVFIILSEFATREKLDDLVMAFEELLDDLTPYYQDQLRRLPDQQREIVEFLCRQACTVAVKEIAGGLFLTEQTAAAQLKQLKDKRYVTAGSLGRESRYELAEPLIRLCVEVKDPCRNPIRGVSAQDTLHQYYCVDVKSLRVKPIRLIVEFLRIWYDRAEVETRLCCLPVGADLELSYLCAALEASQPGIPSPLEVALDLDLARAKASGDLDQVVRVLVEQGSTANSMGRCHQVASELLNRGRPREALVVCDRGIELDPMNAHAWNNRGWALNNLARYVEALAACNRAIELDATNVHAWNNKGWALNALARHTDALVACTRAIELDPRYIHAWNNKGRALNNLARYAEALTSCDRAIELDPNYMHAWNNKGRALMGLGRHAEAAVAFVQSAQLNPTHRFACCTALELLNLGRLAEALTVCERALTLDPKCAHSWSNKALALNRLGRHAEALNAADQALVCNPKSANAWTNKGHALDGLDRHTEALASYDEAVRLGAVPTAWWLNGAWMTPNLHSIGSGVDQSPALAPSSQPNSWDISGVIEAVFCEGSDSTARKHGVGRLIDTARNAQEAWVQMKELQEAEPNSLLVDTDSLPSPFTVLGSSLVRSLMSRAYGEASADSLDAWADAWREVGQLYPDLSLATRLFGVGVRYLRSKDERVLLDLVQEERSILRELIGLDAGTDRG